MNETKVYVGVNVLFSSDGKVIPQSIIWENGKKYIIDKVIDVRRMASTKAGGIGLRYLCLVSGKEVSLYYENNNLWFMERAS